MQTTRPDAAIDKVVETLKFLSDKNRLRIVSALVREETCVCDLIGELELSQPLVSYHLGKLRKAGLVRARRDAQWVYYSLDPDAWNALRAPLEPLFGTGALPPEAAQGASARCSLMPPDPERGASSGDNGSSSTCC